MSDITVERQEGNALQLRWDPEEKPDLVVVSASPSEPHSIDDVEVLIDDASATVALADHHPSRVYLHLFAPDGAHTIVAERLVPLEGALNFRDIGGYRTADGGQVSWGRVFRSDGLATLTEADLRVLDDLGVKLVCDFRGPHEEAEAPSKIVHGGPIDLLRVPIGDGSVERKQMWEQIKDRELTYVGVDEMSAYYILALDQFAPVFGSVLEHIADPANHAVVFHCTAGKDRTGMLAALLLSVLGVDDETILHDYDLTNGYRYSRRMLIREELSKEGVNFDDFRPFFTAVPEVLGNALTDLRERWGSIEAFLTGPAGMKPETIESLRRELVTPSVD